MTATTPTPGADARPVTARTEQAADLAIAAGTTALHLPTIRAEASRIAQAAVKERLTHKAFLAEVLTAELDDREARRRTRRIHEAKFPRIKRLEDLDLRQLPGLPPPLLAALSTPGRGSTEASPSCCSGTPAPARRTVRLTTEGSRAFSAPEYQSRCR